MKALVTGGAGFIGSNLVNYLLRHDWEVQIADLTNGADLLKPEVADRAVEGANVVFHLAADSSVSASLTNHTKDLGGPAMMMNLLEAMNNHGIRKMAFVSSSAVYGEPKQIPTTEESPKEPISLYGAAKLSAESLARAFTELAPLRIVVYRLGNPLGEGARKGVVWNFTRRLMDDPKQLTILGDGTQTRCFFDVSDCISAIMAGLYATTKAFEVYNVAGNTNISIRQTAEIIADELGAKPEFIFKGGQRGWPGDIHTSNLSTVKLRATGWAPRYSVEDSIRRAVRWSKSQS